MIAALKARTGDWVRLEIEAGGAREVARFRRRPRTLREPWGRGKVEWSEIRQSVVAWIGHAMHGDAQRLRARLFSDGVFVARGA